MRSGTRSECKRRYRESGVRPLCRVKLGYEFTYLYAAICPFSGHLYSLLLPDMTKDSFELFVSGFAKEMEGRYGVDQKVLLCCDGAAAHRLPQTGRVAALLQEEEEEIGQQQEVEVEVGNIVLQRLPTASPELNPVERFFEELRKELANHIFESIGEVEDRIIAILKKWYEDSPALTRLTKYPYFSTA